MSKFQSEERYLVAKISRLKLKDVPEEYQDAYVRNLKQKMAEALVDCVVVEKDWPIYEETWENVQRLAEGRETFGSELVGLRAENVAIKEENERMESDIQDVTKEAERWEGEADRLDNELHVIHEENEKLKNFSVLQHKEISDLKARVAELEGDLKLIDAALAAKKAISDGFVDIPAEIDSVDKFLEWVRKEPANEQ